MRDLSPVPGRGRKWEKSLRLYRVQTLLPQRRAKLLLSLFCLALFSAFFVSSSSSSSSSSLSFNASTAMSRDGHAEVGDHSDVPIWKVSLLASLMFLTAASNGCCIAAILNRRPRKKMSRMYFFLFHLSVADALTAVTTLLPELTVTAARPEFYGGESACRVVKFVQMIAPYLR